jgi:hypothetical protein
MKNKLEELDEMIYRLCCSGFESVNKQQVQEVMRLSVDELDCLLQELESCDRIFIYEDERIGHSKI